jgi:hypothetical protein
MGNVMIFSCISNYICTYIFSKNLLRVYAAFYAMPPFKNDNQL